MGRAAAAPNLQYKRFVTRIYLEILKLNSPVHYRCPIVKCQHLMLKYVQV